MSSSFSALSSSYSSSCTYSSSSNLLAINSPFTNAAQTNFMLSPNQLALSTNIQISSIQDIPQKDAVIQIIEPSGKVVEQVTVSITRPILTMLPIVHNLCAQQTHVILLLNPKTGIGVPNRIELSILVLILIY